MRKRQKMGGKLTMIHGYDDEDKTKVEVLSKSEAASQEDLDNVQSQLNGKANNSHTHDDRYYTESEMNAKLNAKQNTVTGGASTVVSANLTGNRVVVSNTAGKIGVSGVSSGELNNLSGSRSNIQDQIDTKASIVNIPGNYKLRAGTTVRNIEGGYTYDLFTDGELNQMLGVNNVSNLTCFVGVLNGDFEAHDNRADNVAYIASAGKWQVRFGDSAPAGQYRFNYIIVYFG